MHGTKSLLHLNSSKSVQFMFICKALFTIQITAKQLLRKCYISTLYLGADYYIYIYAFSRRFYPKRLIAIQAIHFFSLCILFSILVVTMAEMYSKNHAVSYKSHLIKQTVNTINCHD